MTKVQKRRFTRINFSREVTLDFQDRSYYSCRTKDLSLCGMFVHSKFAESEGSCCRVVLRQVGPGTDLTIIMTAKVVREDREGMAIEFTSMAFDSYMFLQVILLYEAEDPFSICLEYPENCPFKLIDTDSVNREQSETYQ